MEYFKVIVKVKAMEGFKGAFEEHVYEVYSNSAEEAANSVCIQKKVEPKNIKGVQVERRY